MTRSVVIIAVPATALLAIAIVLSAIRASQYEIPPASTEHQALIDELTTKRVRACELRDEVLGEIEKGRSHFEGLQSRGFEIAVRRLASPDPQAREGALAVIHDQLQAAESPVVRATLVGATVPGLTSPHSDVRVSCIRFLPLSPAALLQKRAWLLERLADGSECSDVRGAVAEVLGASAPDAAVTEALTSALKVSDSWVASSAAIAILHADARSPRALLVLRRSLENPEIAERVGLAASDIGSSLRSHLGWLPELCKSAHPSVRTGAILVAAGSGDRTADIVAGLEELVLGCTASVEARIRGLELLLQALPPASAPALRDAIRRHDDRRFAAIAVQVLDDFSSDAPRPSREPIRAGNHRSDRPR